MPTEVVEQIVSAIAPVATTSPPPVVHEAPEVGTVTIYDLTF
jgi:hypothetical protein